MQNNNDIFHEAKQALNSAKIEFSQVGSLSLVSAFTPVHACDLAVRELYTLATNSSFPHDSYKPYHKPGILVDKLGIKFAYSTESQKYLDQLNGYAQEEARYNGTQAYKNYTNPKSIDRAGKLINGAERFIKETENLSHNQQILDVIRNNCDMTSCSPVNKQHKSQDATIYKSKKV
jgi:hypothetical protein